MTKQLTGRRLLCVLLALLILLTACGGGSCAHLRCAPQTGILGKIGRILEDGRDGIIDPGESKLGDAILRAAGVLPKPEK